MKRKKSTGPRTDPCGTPRNSKEAAFVIVINHASAPIRKVRLSPTSKARRKASRNEFMAKGRMPDRVKSFQEVDSREDRPRARPYLLRPPSLMKSKLLNGYTHQLLNLHDYMKLDL